MTSRRCTPDVPDEAPSTGDGAVPSVAPQPTPVEGRLLALLREADAFATQLGLTAAESGRLVAARASEASSGLAALRVALTDAGVLQPDSEAAASIARLLALLKLLWRAAVLRGRHRADAQARRIAEATADLQGDVVTTVARAQRRLDRAVLQALRRFEKAHEELQLQLRAAGAVERLTRSQHGGELDQRRRRLAADVAAVARRLTECRDRLAAQRETSAISSPELDDERRARIEEAGVKLARLLGPRC